MKALNLTDLRSLEQELSEYHMKLVAFAKQAHLELKHNVARLFEALSFSKQVQAIFVLNCIGCIKDTKSNIEDFLNEINSCDTQRERLPNNEIEIIEKFNEIEEKNRHLYTCAVDSLEAGKDISIGTINVCSKCGYLLLGDTPKDCIMCHSPSGFFRIY